MHRLYRIVFILSVILLVIVLHSGRTDGNGGHYDHSTGEYHYHHGEGPHQHYDMDGDGIKDCPLERREKIGNAIATAIFSLAVLSVPLLGLIMYVCGGICSMIEKQISKKSNKNLNHATSNRIWTIVFILTTIVMIAITFIIVFIAQGII